MKPKKKTKKPVTHLALQHAIATTIAKQYPSLGRFYVLHLRDSAKKIQHNLGPAIKHTYCRRCNTVFFDGSNCTIQDDGEFTEVICCTCGYRKRTRHKYRPSATKEDVKDHTSTSPSPLSEERILSESKHDMEQKDAPCETSEIVAEPSASPS